MSKWEMVRLINIFEKPLSGIWGEEDTEGLGTPVLRTTNFTNFGLINYDNVTTRIIQEKQLEPKLLKFGDIIIEKSGGSPNQPVGRVVVFEQESDIYTFNNFTSVLRSKDSNTYYKYLFYALFSVYKLGKVNKFQNKTTGIINLKLASYLEDIQIPLPPLEEQKRIAKNLDLASEIVKGYKTQLEELDKLIQSVFYDMFGDPVTNEKGWNLQKGTEIFKLSNGKTVPENRRFPMGIPAYGGNGISWYTNEILFNKDTIVIGRVGFQSGNVRLVKAPVWITDNAMYISKFYNSNYNLVFIHKLMEIIDFSRFQDAGDLKKITQKPFNEMNFLLPPLDLQQKFADIVTEIEIQKAQVQTALGDAEQLYNSLMQEYFE